MKIHKTNIYIILLLNMLFVHNSAMHGAFKLLNTLVSVILPFIYHNPHAIQHSPPVRTYILGVHQEAQQPLYDILHDLSPYDHYLITPCAENYNKRNDSLCINALRVITEPLCEHVKGVLLSCHTRNAYPIQNIPNNSLIPSDTLPSKAQRAASVRALLKNLLPLNARVYIQHEISEDILTQHSFYRNTLLRKLTRELLGHATGIFASLQADRKQDYPIKDYISRIIFDGSITTLDFLKSMETELLSDPQRPVDHQALRNLQQLQTALHPNNHDKALLFRPRIPGNTAPKKPFIRAKVVITHNKSIKFSS